VTGISKDNTKAVTKAIVASVTVGFSVLGLPGCSGGSSSPQPIQTAPASPLTSHIKQCYTAKLNGPARTVIREKIQVCRRDSSNQPVEQELTPRFQMGRTKGSKIGFRQVIAVKLSSGDTATEPVSPERLALDASALEFLTKACAPIINAVFQRSGFDSSHRFQAYREGDQVALSSEFSKNGVVTEEFEFGDPKQLKPAAVKDQPVATRAIEDDPANRSYHLLLEMKLSKENGLRLVDEIADVESGSLVGYVPSPLSTQLDPADGIQTARLQFCGQLAMRVAENYGLSEGRDCKSMIGNATSGKATDAPKAADKDSAKPQGKPGLAKNPAIGLMKPGKSVSDLGKVKLAKREIHDILVPVCGPLKDQKGI
jgi:hypothetical protein